MKIFTILAATAAAAMALPAMAAPAVAETPGAVIQPRQTVAPGTVVMAADGSELGRLEGSRTSVDGVIQVVVRDADGNMRGIPTTAVTLHDDHLRATWTAAQFRTAPVLVPVAGMPGPGSGGAQGQLPEATELDPLTLGPTYDDPTRRSPIEQQQAPAENTGERPPY